MRSERLPFTSTVQKAALLVILSVGVVGGAAAIDDPYVFATIDPPGATWAEAYGINAVGDIVGVYGDAAGQHGFLLDRDEFTSIDYPGANLTSAFGINPGGEIVGVYRGISTPYRHESCRTARLSVAITTETQQRRCMGSS